MGRIQNGKWITFAHLKGHCSHWEHGFEYGRSYDVCESGRKIVRCSEKTCWIFQNWGKTKTEIAE